MTTRPVATQVERRRRTAMSDGWIGVDPPVRTSTDDQVLRKFFPNSLAVVQDESVSVFQVIPSGSHQRGWRFRWLATRCLWRTL
jgi:hypothetical protein